jgi:hypothetical protein
METYASIGLLKRQLAGKGTAFNSYNNIATLRQSNGYKANNIYLVPVE